MGACFSQASDEADHMGKNLRFVGLFAIALLLITIVFEAIYLSQSTFHATLVLFACGDLATTLLGIIGAFLRSAGLLLTFNITKIAQLLLLIMYRGYFIFAVLISAANPAPPIFGIVAVCASLAAGCISVYMVILAFRTRSRLLEPVVYIVSPTVATVAPISYYSAAQNSTVVPSYGSFLQQQQVSANNPPPRAPEAV